MCTLARVACAGPIGEASALPWQSQSPTKYDSCPTSGEGAGGPLAAGGWETAGRAAKAPTMTRAHTKAELSLKAILRISNLLWNPPDGDGRSILRKIRVRG